MTAGSLQLSSFHFIVWEINTKLAAETPQIRHNVKQVHFSLFTVYILEQKWCQPEQISPLAPLHGAANRTIQ